MPAPFDIAWLTVNPGELRHLVELQQQTTAPDTVGQPQPTWTTIRTAYAAIAVATQKETWQPSQFTSDVTHTIKLRWTLTTIRPAMRVVYGTHVYQIQAVDNVLQKNLVLRLLVQELNASSD
jgi:SPP1 family predicted phage head-tail adaptor